jgi:hypothetical protein
MTRVGWGCSVLVLACAGCRADEATTSASVKRVAQDLGAATVTGDYAKVIDLTHDSLVKMMGGREKAIAATAAAMNQMKASGFALTAYDVGDPGKLYSEGGSTFVVIPTSTHMTVPGGRVTARSYLLGISPDGGKTWRFVDGTGITKHKDKLDQLLPRLPADLRLPEVEKPELFKDK